MTTLAHHEVSATQRHLDSDEAVSADSNELHRPLNGAERIQCEIKSLVAISEADATTLRLPARLFYWSLIEASDLPRGRRDGSHLGARAILEERFQADLPLPIESLAVVFVPIADADSVIGCGLPIERLKQELVAVSAALRLGPDAIPALFLLARGRVDAECINLLVGEHEPAALGSIRSSQRRWVMLAAILTLVVVSIGVRWREVDASRQIALLREHTASSLRSVGLPGTFSADESHSESVASKVNHLRSRLLATRGPAAAAALPPDAADAIAVLLGSWPKEIETRANRVSINEQGIALTVEVHDQAAADVLGRALATVPGWELQPPQAIRNGTGVMLSATLKRSVRDAANKAVPGVSIQAVPTKKDSE